MIATGTEKKEASTSNKNKMEQNAWGGVGWGGVLNNQVHGSRSVQTETLKLFNCLGH